MQLRSKKTLPAAFAAFAILACADADANWVRTAELADLDLEQLAAVSVTTATRREERLLDVPNAIFVVTGEDIRRSGVTNIYEALRLAPNLQVVRGDSSQYIVTARGGLGGLANKMLVLVDGRTVYSPLFSGVFPDAQMVFLEDIERVEVISGPGSTLWGTNAVNGVINVITKSAARTRGTLASAGAGEHERLASVRHGGSMGGWDWRAYGRYHERDAQRLASGASAVDASERGLAGLRLDRERGRETTTLQAEAYTANVDNLGGYRPLSGGHVLGRWRGQAAGGDLMLQGYYDRTEREHVGSFAEKRDTFDVELQHGIPRGDHRIVWGGGYRVSRDDTVTTPALGFMPEDRALRLASLFAQDIWRVSPTLQATLGLRAERNDYTGLEWLPNARLQWHAARDQMVWGALTRTVRSPSRIDRELVVPGSAPFLLVPGNFESEIAKVAELGYRGRLGSATVSATAFHHDFEKLRTVEPAGGHLVFANGAEGRVHGVSGWIDYRVTPDWRLVGGMVAMRTRFEVVPGRVDAGNSAYGNDPDFTASLRSQWNITRALELDAFVRHSAELPNPRVPASTVADVALTWRASRNLELTLRVANVFDREAREFGTEAQGAVFGRSAYLKLTWVP